MNVLAMAVLARDVESTLTASDGTLDYMPIFKVIIALYLLYVGALGKGKVLENKFLKMDEKKFRLYMRLIALAGALFTLGDSAIEYFLNGDATFEVIGTVLWVLGMLALVGMLALSIAATDRKAAAEAQRQADEIAIQKQKEKLRAAFVFEEEKAEEKADDKPEE